MAKGWIHDSGKYRQPTEHEADELRRLMKMMDQAVARDDDVTHGRAVEAIKKLLKTMEIPK
jgi:hypothetical protein